MLLDKKVRQVNRQNIDVKIKYLALGHLLVITIRAPPGNAICRPKL